MMTDPAELAVLRSGATPPCLQAAEAAAREALAPLQAACRQLRANADTLGPNSPLGLGMRSVLDDLACHIFVTHEDPEHCPIESCSCGGEHDHE